MQVLRLYELRGFNAFAVKQCSGSMVKMSIKYQFVCHLRRALLPPEAKVQACEQGGSLGLSRCISAQNRPSSAVFAGGGGPEAKVRLVEEPEKTSNESSKLNNKTHAAEGARRPTPASAVAV